MIITNFTRAEDVVMVSDKVMDGSTPWYLFPGKPNATYPVYNKRHRIHLQRLLLRLILIL